MVPCLLGAAFAVSGCGSPSPSGACLAILSLSVVATVRDSITGAAAAEGAVGTMVGLGVEDSLFASDSLTLVGGQHTGVFTVKIDRPGYFTWRASDVHVARQAGACGTAITVKLNARLQRDTP